MAEFISDQDVEHLKCDLLARMDATLQGEGSKGYNQVWFHNVIVEASERDLILLMTVAAQWYFDNMEAQGQIVILKRR